ncbi:zinc finger homeobox protein 3-like [Scleropages formosus]|uniref:zinc finger homeobox protein 3-like n=1 Tax=Scleropages formosus TaxID=113540 RepID=UPI0008780C10|nr:zinc finger homeobox protein 3-like [Scleropages formosus]
MQEECGESVQTASSVLVWPCPLCQQDRTDRDALAQHLTDKHSVLPACLDRLLDTAAPVHHGSGREMEETDDEKSTDVVSSKQMPSESNGAPCDLSETEVNNAGSKRSNASTWVPRGSWTKVMPCPEKDSEGEEESEQEGVKDTLECDEDRPPDPESSKTLKSAPKSAANRDIASDGKSITNSSNTSKAPNDPVLEKFLDPNRPFKCNACLESFTSKSALGVHYSSATHLQRMRTGSGKQGDENETLPSSTAASQPLSRPFISNKPYQCAVCRVSYNHAFTLESHMKSVLHQTRSRNAIHSVSGTSDKKGTVHSGNAITTSAVNTPIPGVGSVVKSAHFGSTSTSSIQGSSNSLTGATKDTEQSQLQTVPSACSPSAPALSLLSSPVASPQAVSAFLTLLTSNSHSVTPPLQPSLFTANTSTPPGTTAPQLELIAQQRLLMPLFLNGLQNQNSNLDSPSAVLAHSVPLLDLSTAQQALQAQRLNSIQNPSSGLLAGLAAVMQTNAGPNEREETSDVIEKANREIVEKGESSQGKEEHVNESLNSQSQEGERERVENIAVNESSVERCVSDPEGMLSNEQTRQVEVSVHISVKEEIASSDSTEQSKFEQRAFEKADKMRDASQMIHDGVDKLKCSKSPKRQKKTLSLCDSNCSINETSFPSNMKPSVKFCPKETTQSSSSSLDLDKNTKLTNCINTSLMCSSNSSNGSSGGPSLIQNEHLPPSAVSKMKSSNPFLGLPGLSEFQSQVLWAFLESRSDGDAASPPREDCEALGREVGLDEAVVRRWLGDARQAREKERNSSGKAASTEANKALDRDEEEEEGVLTIVETEEGESPTTSSHAVDLSYSGGRGSPGESGLTSDSDNDGYYTSFIVTDEESQNDSVREETGSSLKEEAVKEEKVSGRGKVLRSSTVFLSDAEDSEEEEDAGNHKAKKRKRTQVEEVEMKKERLDSDVDLELEAQADPPPLSVSVEQQGIPRISASSSLQTLPMSVSLSPFSTQFLNPYVLSLHPSAVRLAMAEGDRERDKGRPPAFQNPPANTRCSGPFLNSLKGPPPASHMSPAKPLSNGGICESALDLSIGKKQSSTCSSSPGEKTAVQRDHTVDGLGIRQTALAVPGTGGLIVVRVKPDSAVALPTSNSNVNSNNNARTSTVYIRAAERLNASRMEKEKEKVHVKETESEKQQKQTKARRYRDMRRSRTIIQTEQLDVLYGCYFKDPNPGKHEFERISEWVHLPKKVVQIWFQNMRARERKGEVRFISDGTLAAVGKPLIKFTWPLTLPIFSSSPSPNTSAPCSGGIAKVSAGATSVTAPLKVKMEKVQDKEKKESMPKEVGAAASLSLLTVPKSKPESQVQVALAKSANKIVAAAPAVPIMVMKSHSSPGSLSYSKRKRGKEEEEEEEEKTDEEEEDHGTEKVGPGSTNRMVPKLSPALNVKPPASGSHKHNGLSDWSPKGTFKINTLTREQLGLSSTGSSVTNATATSTPPNSSSTAKSSPQEGAFPHHSAPRRPRTHLTSLQVSIMQSCYETCPHPNALECETVGTELGLPLKVVQIWFQNTRAKEKRWRLQMQKQSPSATESSKKIDTSSGSFLLYNALRANRPILPKPVQLTVLEPSAPPGLGQPAGRETLRGRCEACGVDFESRAAGRTHVFSPRHLATLRSTNFGQPPSLVSKGSGAGSASSSGVAAHPSPSTASTTS